MTCSITARKGLEPSQYVLFDIRDRTGNLLCTVFGSDLAERLAALMTEELRVGKNSYGVVFAALSRLDCELIARSVGGDELWWATAGDAPRIRSGLISALAAGAVAPVYSPAPGDIDAPSVPTLQ
ncbi:MAG: hypothetical protein KIS73_13690 [Enhydrobacter sp.]|nr:hypothetical protein [Enhydrobacter sp.]